MQPTPFLILSTPYNTLHCIAHKHSLFFFCLNLHSIRTVLCLWFCKTNKHSGEGLPTFVVSYCSALLCTEIQRQNLSCTKKTVQRFEFFLVPFLCILHLLLSLYSYFGFFSNSLRFFLPLS